MDVERHEHARRTGRMRWVWWAFAAAAAYYLIAEHRAHAAGLVGLLPWLILAACPLMHVFGHGGHGAHGGARTRAQGSMRDTPPARSRAADAATGDAVPPHVHPEERP